MKFTARQADGRISQAETDDRLRKVRHGCTSIHDRDRLRQFIVNNTREGGNKVSDKRLAFILPTLIRTEAQAVRAAADEAGDAKLHQRANSLESWASEVYEYNLQQAAINLLHKPPPGTGDDEGDAS